jgi:hypothetical protein
MAVTVPAPMLFDQTLRRRLTGEAILYMARQFGFLDMATDLL